jgi:hypothetical protein
MNFNKHLCFIACSAVLTLAATCQAQTSPPLWSATANYKIGDVVTYGYATFQCLINESAASRPNPHTPSWDLNFNFNGPTPFTIPVGPTEAFHTLTSAWDYIAYARIAANSSIVIKFDSNYSSETQTKSFSLDHPFGSQISIVGTGTGSQVINFTARFTAGFTLDSGHSFGGLYGFGVSAPAGGTRGAPGIQVSQNAVLSNAQELAITNFDIGFVAETSGTIDNIGTISLKQFVIGGAQAITNGILNFLPHVTFDGSQTTGGTPPTYGFQALGGTISCPYCTANNCFTGFNAVDSGKIEANYSTVSTPSTVGYDGYIAQNHGFINASQSQVTGGYYGYESLLGSFLDATHTSSTDYGNHGLYAAQASTINAQGNNEATQYADATSNIFN